MNSDQLREIIDNPATSPRDRAAALEKLKQSEPKASGLEALILAKTKRVSLVEVTDDEMRDFCRECRCGDELSRRRHAMWKIAWWRDYLAGTDHERLAKFISLLYPDGDTEEKRQQLAHKEIADAEKELEILTLPRPA